MAQGRRRQIDPKRFAPLLRRAREEAALTFEQLAQKAGTTARSVQRWEAAVVPPTRSLREPLARALGGASFEAWRALVEVLGLPVDAMLARVPLQAAKAAPPLPPPAPPPAPAPPPVDPRAVLDDAVRATAEELDVTARKVRAAFAQLLVDLERLGLSYAAARELLLGRGKPDRVR
jgi:transcriptional regulator with XRE-family HTH domain